MFKISSVVIGRKGDFSVLVHWCLHLQTLVMSNCKNAQILTIISV